MPELEKEVAGALKHTINAHGPVSENKIGSATKWIASAIREAAKRQRDHLMTTTPRKPRST